MPISDEGGQSHDSKVLRLLQIVKVWQMLASACRYLGLLAGWRCVGAAL